MGWDGMGWEWEWDGMGMGWEWEWEWVDGDVLHAFPTAQAEVRTRVSGHDGVTHAI